MSVRYLGVLLVAVTVLHFSAQSSRAQELSPPGGQWEYHLGHGLRLGDTGLTLGGYGSVQYDDWHDRLPEFAAS
ncbi:MAG: hypothetical protein HY268_04015, partial [Deltaproteobacteria bacterium]|nr:hypothetical protein [Deltaproteobacteria bacterium]